MSRVAELEAGRALDHEDDFAAYVHGRTIAVVGPAPLEAGDLDAIRDHDLVYAVEDHAAHGLPADIHFANRIAMNARLRGRPVHPEATWTVTKAAPHGLPNTRKARYPANINLNQVPIALWDLTNFAPADVNVYGADLYMSGPGRSYTAAYSTEPPNKHYNGIISHQPQLQHANMVQIRRQTGWFSRSARLAAVLDLDTDEYFARLRALWVPAVYGSAS